MLRRHNLIKVVFFFIVCLVFLSSTVSGFEFDNVKDYNEETKTIEITNAFGLGDKIAEITLDSPPINYVIRGEDRLVAEFTIFNEESYEDVFKNLEFYNVKRDLREITRDFTYRYKQTSEITINDYVTNCKERVLINESIEKYDCVETKSGDHKEERYNWIDFNPNLDLAKGNITIGIFTDVIPNEIVEWIPTLYGIRIDEWAVWTEALNVDLAFVYRMENVIGANEEAESIFGLHNATLVTVNQGEAGKLELGINFTLDNSNFTITDVDTLNSDIHTFNLWVRSTLGTGQVLISIFNARTYFDYSSDRVRANVFKDPTGSTGYFYAPIEQNVWTMVTFVSNGTNTLLYTNGTYVTHSTNYAGILDSAIYGCLGFDCPYGGTHYKGDLDEYYYWTRILTPTEINQLYNDGIGIAYFVDAPPTIALNSPDDNTVRRFTNATFSCTGEDDLQIENVSLIIDGDINYTVTDGVDNYTDLDYTINNLIDGVYDWECNAVDSANNIGTSEEYTLTIDSTPNITYEDPTPINNFNTSSNGFTINFSVTEDYFDEITFYLHDTTGEVDKTTYADSIRYITYSGLGEENYTYNATIRTTTGQENSTLTRNIRLDLTPPDINITSPTVVNFHRISNNLTVEWTITESYPDLCIGSFDSGITNITLVCDDLNISRNITSFAMDNFMFWANDSVGNSALTTRTWEYKVFEKSIIYNENTLEGTIENYELNVSVGSSYALSSIYFWYNNTNRGAATITTSGNDYSLVNSLAIIGITEEINQSFHWALTVDDSTKVNSTMNNQTARIINIDDCSAYSILFMNLSLRDEDTQNFINATNQNSTIKVDFDLYPDGSTTSVYNYSNNFTKIKNPVICLEADLAGVSFDLDLLITYDGDDYALEHYNIEDDNLINSTLPIEIDLFDLLASEATTFELTYKDEDFLAVDNALIQIQRKYIEEGVSKTIEVPKTSTKGETVASLVLNDVIYTFIIVKDGEVLATFNDVRAVCQNPALEDCSINFNSFISAIDPGDYTVGNDFQFTLSYNKTTRTVKTIFSIPSNNPAVINLNITKMDGLSTYICGNSLESSSGTLTCVIPTSVGNGTFAAKVYKDNTLSGSAFFIVRSTPTDLYGSNLVFLGLFLFITLAGIGLSSNPLITGFFVMIGGIVGVILNVFYNPTFIGAGATILWLFIAVILIIIKGSKRS